MKTIRTGVATFAAIFAAFGVAMAQDFGRAPADYQDAATDYIEDRLEDPRGARVEFLSDPYRVYADIGRYESLPAWAVDIHVRSRLPGGRRGAASYTVIFVDGDPVALEDDVYQLTRL